MVGIIEYAFADVLDEFDDKAFVVDGSEGACEHFAGFEKVVEIRGRVVLAGVAVAGVVNGLESGLETRVGYIYASGRGVERTVATNACGADAVKCIGAVFDTRENIIGFTNAEHVAWLVFG